VSVPSADRSYSAPTYSTAFDRHTEQHLEAAGLGLVVDRFLYKEIIKLLLVRPEKVTEK